MENENNFTYESVLKDIDSYTKKSYILTFLTWATLIGVIWVFSSIFIISFIWNFTSILKFTQVNGELNCEAGLTGFWKIGSIDNVNHIIHYIPNSKWGLIFIPIFGYIFTIGCSIGVIVISNHRKYRFKIYYKNFLNDFDISNSSVDINKSIFKTNLFYFQITWIIILTISFITIFSLSLEKPNIVFAFQTDKPSNVLKYWNWSYVYQTNIVNGEEVKSLYINSRPDWLLITFFVIESLSLAIISICNFFYKKYIDKGIMDGIDKIIDEYFYDENYEMNID